MNNLLPLFVVGCGLWLSFLGVWGRLSTFRTGSGAGSAGEPTSRASAAVTVKAKVPTSLRIKQIGGLFWFCMGIATLWFSGIRDPRTRPNSWTLASVGLFWVVIGVWEFLTTVPRRVRRQLLSEENGRLAEIVTQHVEQAFPEGHVGLVVGAIAKDEEILLGFGARQVRGSQPPDADTVFEIGSISKAFTGILLAQRIESGELELDDRIAELLPEGWSLSEPAREITLRHCTTHTSGFPRLPANLLGISDVFHMLLGGDPYRDYSEEEFRNALATVKLTCDPGTEWGYSNFAAGLLGFVLATQNGTDYETLVTSKICQPLGMHRTTITNDDWLREHMPANYRFVLNLGPASFGLKSDEWQLPNHLAGAGAIRSTGRDMMTFLKANMGLIPTPIDAAIQRSHQVLFQERADRAMGMNWIRSFESAISQNIIWHNGGTGGFRTYLGFTEDHQYGVFVLSNTAIVGVDALAAGILKTLVRDQGPVSLPQSMATPR
ncbi:serine hydrolase domain-containing protein [Singulisphaera acidiphila]|uniref:Beta-lactamase n=1 Tax=Singulisphaera acidiphila (strain ATCC BAA-1392 / DSM 18658 / VKM B-2454 / MOB10) TaxID=886293 RepID=L0DHH7_SINAD|nr:serine hydrolase domain-containing protein [Singulisphaera acidiphila]AGA28305.1 penicillin-binding protein, beta-lactamase class C [Singulisphaera acidiphila DSM 18658]